MTAADGRDHPNGTNIRFLNNQFGRKFHTSCGIYGPISSWDGGNTGNQWTGNTWADTGEAIRR